MLTITNSAEMARVLSTLTDTTLKRILTDRVEQLAEYDGYDLGELAHWLIVQPGDTLDTIETALGFSPVTSLAEVLSDHGGWFEAVLILSDDGFGWCMLVPDDPAVPLDLLELFRGASEVRESS
ncbi:hypothetical protein [Novosphingobium percolationis]|uniref:hypothetical protein n=1 Tax=Novosphingobium percolationis TaxID=2871811 RepID=UPI001CD3310D|nr:hypothetical protein [Novosphingobium percolationis]